MGMSVEDKAMCAQIRKIFQHDTEDMTCHANCSFPSWMQLSWSLSTVSRNTLMQIMEAVPRIKGMRIDFLKKQVSMTCWKASQGERTQATRRKKRKRTETGVVLTLPPWPSEKIVSKTDKELVRRILQQVCVLKDCKPSSIDIRVDGAIYDVRCTLRECIAFARFLELWEKFHAHLLSMSFELSSSTLSIHVNKPKE